MTHSDYLIVCIVAVSVMIQCAAAAMAIRLIEITGKRAAWGLIAAALVLMTLRRIVPLYRLFIGDTAFPPDPFNESIGLLLSLAMALGIARVAPLFNERLQAEAALLHLNRELRAISNCNQLLMRAKDEQSLLQGICHIICAEAGYRMAWVGYVEHDAAKRVRPVVWSGAEHGYLENADITWADTERGRGPTGTTTRTGVTTCIQDFSSEPLAAPRRESALQRGYHSSIALALRDENADIFGVLTIYSATPNTFTPAEVRLLEELASDMAFGINVLRNRIERKQADAVRTQLAAIVESSNDAIIGKTLDGIITHWNRSAEKIYGYKADEIIGQHITTLAPPSLHAEIRTLLQKIRDGETVSHHEASRIRKDGTSIHVALTLSPIKDATGAITGISTIARDITDRKLAEEKLKRSEQGLAEAQRIAHLGNWELDLLRNKLHWSDEIYRIFEIDPEQFQASYEAFLNLIHPEDRERVDTAYTESVRHHRPYDIEHRLLMPDGRVKYVNEKCETHYDAAGKPIRSTGTIHDITERHIAQLELAKLSLKNKLILDSAGEGIYGLDSHGRCTFVNPTAALLLGYVAEELQGRPFHQMCHHSKADGTPYAEESCPVHSAYTRAEVCRGRDFYWRKDGGGFPVEFVSTPIQVDGKLSGAVVVFSDITERMRVEEELRRYKDHLEEEVQQRTTDLVLARNAAEAANQAKSAFLANMSHELRTPLNAILGFSNMMCKDPQLSEKLRQNLDIINRSGEHLLTLINDVLEMSKIEAGRVQLESAPFDLGGMVRDVTDMMQIRAQEKGLRLLLDQDSKFPRYIFGDEARLRQILINLLGNAIKFTEQGGVTLRLGATKNTHSHLHIEVEDSGPGISPDDQALIFEPFIQLNEQGANKGTGLGLSITRQFVQLMQGSISLLSSPGKGSLFRVDLPLHEVHETEISKPTVTDKGEVIALEPGQPEYRILIIEDQRDNQLLLTLLMESIGLKVKVAENGEEGIRLFQHWHPHLIWMDRRMPVMDGVEATRRIRGLPGGKEVKIVAVTASAFIEQRSELLNAGMDDFVRKPYRSHEIYECLSKQLGLRYVYRNMPVSEEPATQLTPEMLSVLPDALKNEMIEALQSLETERIAQAIQQVAAYDPALQKILERLAEYFDYPTILKALQT